MPVDDDLVTRLRQWGGGQAFGTLHDAAADEIERLQAEKRGWTAIYETLLQVADLPKGRDDLFAQRIFRLRYNVERLENLEASVMGLIDDIGEDNPAPEMRGVWERLEQALDESECSRRANYQLNSLPFVTKAERDTLAARVAELEAHLAPASTKEKEGETDAWI